MSGPAERFWDNAVEITSTVVTGIWLAALFTGQDWWLAALLVGYVVVVPVVRILAGEEEKDTDEWEVDREPAGETAEPGERESTEDALTRLRERYASGDLSDEQFERKLDRLLSAEATESVERGRAEAGRGGGSREREREPE